VDIKQEIEALVQLFNQGCYAEVESRARQMTKRFPQHEFGWRMLGAVLNMQGHDADALEAMEEAVLLSPGNSETHHSIGVILDGFGRLTEAELSYRQALQIQPDFAEAHNSLGAALTQLGRRDEAESSYRRALHFQPDFAEAHSNLSLALYDTRRFAEAESSLRRALHLRPDLAGLHCNLGKILNELGRQAEAEESFRRALEIDPTLAEAHGDLGSTLHAQDQLDEAELSFRRALQIRPAYAEAHCNLGIVLAALGRIEEAEASYLQALSIAPGCLAALSNLGNCLTNQGRLEEGELSYRRALQIKPDFAEAHYSLGILFTNSGRLAEAETSFRQALQSKPDYAEAHSYLGHTLALQDRLEEAEANCRHALQIKPDYAYAHNNLGNVLKDLGRLVEAEASYRRALQIMPGYTEAHSNLLFTLNYDDTRSSAYCLEEARAYGQTVKASAAGRLPDQPCEAALNHVIEHSPDRLRVGLVSGDLMSHPVGYFLESVLAQLDPVRVQLIAFPTQHKTDELSVRIRPHFAKWKPLGGLSDDMATRAIREEGVHVLLDLSGHTAHNRLPVFARKPAPVLASWLGYFATTGLTQMDYLIADPWVLPETDEAYFTERIWRMPETRLCFSAPHVDVPVSPLPALANGYLTFACFNNLTKINDRVVGLWAQVLAAVAGSRLLLKAKQLREVSVRQSIVERFAAYGVDADRLILEGPVQRTDYLAAYRRVDFALDPFPFTGGTTSAESLWMGVPVLTLAGDRLVSRQGVGLLMNAGLPAWIATDADDFISRAFMHAGDLDGLAAIRQGLRQKVLASPLFDAPRFARNLESALWGMWTHRHDH